MYGAALVIGFLGAAFMEHCMFWCSFRVQKVHETTSICCSPMKLQPNVIIIDMAHIVAAHGNKRQRNMFHPHNGMVVEPSQENDDNARQRSLLVSLPWIDKSCKKSNRSEQRKKSIQFPEVMFECACLIAVMMAVWKRKQILRRLALKNFAQISTSQVIEQLHSSTQHSVLWITWCESTTF